MSLFCVYSNNLEELPAAQVSLPHLQTLDLRNNRLNTFPEPFFWQMKELETLHVEANELGKSY